MKLDRYPKDTEGRVSALCTAIMHEAVELQRTTNWKWWKTPTEFNQSEAREELIDIWHFVIQASLELKLTPDDILDEYKRKNQINHERQKNGYQIFSIVLIIDSIIKYVNQNKKIKTIIVCGKDVWGHKSGHSLFELHKNGIDNNNRIINSTSPDPFLTVSESEIKYFQKQITLVNLINETNIELINNKIQIN